MNWRQYLATRHLALPVLTIFLCAGGVGLYAQSQVQPQAPQEPPVEQTSHDAAAEGVQPQAPQEPPVGQASHDAATEGLFARAFGALHWGATNQPGVPNSFALGQFALFVTTALSERVNVLAEIVMEASRNTRVVTDLERLQLTFRLDDHLHLSGGRYHTGIGFYNSAFHHGSYFETSIERPRVFRFEDEGGVLPVHEVGIRASGTVPGTGSGLDYLVEVGNGRSWDERGEDIDAAPDANTAKSTNVGVSFQPERWHGLEMGTSFYRDMIPLEGSGPVDHRVAAAFLNYRTPSIEVLSEWLVLSHRTVEGVSYFNDGGYLQASRAWGKLRPYYRYDRLAVDPGTPFIGYAGSYRANILGLRVDLGPKIAFKAQYERSTEAQQQGIDALRTQLVFVF
jgi:hypothetical protein